MGPQGSQGEIGLTGPQGATGLTGATGPAGTTGAQGPVGTNGTNGTNGVSGWERVVGTATADNETFPKTATATCTGSKKLVGGGYLVSAASASSEIVITASYPSSDTVWTTSGTVDSNTGGDESYSLQAYAICATMN
jgi:hypothetical protein